MNGPIRPPLGFGSPKFPPRRFPKVVLARFGHPPILGAAPIRRAISLCEIRISLVLTNRCLYHGHRAGEDVLVGSGLTG